MKKCDVVSNFNVPAAASGMAHGIGRLVKWKNEHLVVIYVRLAQQEFL